MHPSAALLSVGAALLIGLPGAVAAADGPEPMIGEFVYFADAAAFQDCRTGDRWAVAQEGDYLALERAYLDARAEPMAPVVAVIDGTIAEREGMEGGQRDMVVVSRMSMVVPGLTCERAQAEPSLTETYWRLLRMDGAPAPVVDDTREPHLVLRDEDDRFTATVGCNQMLGDYDAGKRDLKLRSGPITLMGCPPPLDEAEPRFIDLLELTATYRIIGPTLELIDADGAALLQFEAVFLP